MSPSSTPFLSPFNWGAPLPQLFTRASGPTFWASDSRYRPLDLGIRLGRDLIFLVERTPPELRALVQERFKPTRGPLRWDTPPALPTNIREAYVEAALGKLSETGLRAAVTVTTGWIERLLNAPEGMVGGLTHNFLLTMQIARLRQLWRETERRYGSQAGLVVFQRALG